jgi:hypothetical protein
MPIFVPVLCQLRLTDACAIAWLVATTATIATIPKTVRPWLRQRRLNECLPVGASLAQPTANAQAQHCGVAAVRPSR